MMGILEAKAHKEFADYYSMAMTMLCIMLCTL